MILTMAMFEETDAQLDEGIRHVREEVVPSLAGAEGLLSVYWVVDREGGRRLSMMVWSDAGAMSSAMNG